jgi:hypothetical protein
MANNTTIVDANSDGGGGSVLRAIVGSVVSGLVVALVAFVVKEAYKKVAGLRAARDAVRDREIDRVLVALDDLEGGGRRGGLDLDRH